jgi:hypothetical protein
MIKVAVGIIVGLIAATIFPQEAMTAYDFVRDQINTAARLIAEKTG